jgi:hypothetical protein
MGLLDDAETLAENTKKELAIQEVHKLVEEAMLALANAPIYKTEPVTTEVLTNILRAFETRSVAALSGDESSGNVASILTQLVTALGNGAAFVLRMLPSTDIRMHLMGQMIRIVEDNNPDMKNATRGESTVKVINMNGNMENIPDEVMEIIQGVMKNMANEVVGEQAPPKKNMH